MTRVRVKTPVEPKIIEMPAQLLQEAPTAISQSPEDTVPETQVTEATAPQPATAVMPELQGPASQNVPRGGITISGRSLVLMSVGTLVLVLFITGIIVSKNNHVDTPETLGTSTVAHNEPQIYYDIVSKYVELPTDELPTVANVSEADKVKEQTAVLTDVKNGDKMLFFTKSRKVVVYRPSSKKVVAVVSLAIPVSPANTTQKAK